MPAPRIVVRIQAEDFDTAAEIATLGAVSTDIGAVVSFSGLCRGEAGTLAALELEHYPGMAEKAIGGIVDEAIARWPLAGITVIHRHGRVSPGENIVLVVTASAHRQAAFEAATFLMDYLKSRAPFWKRGIGADGQLGAWVEAKDTDEDLSRWEG